MHACMYECIYIFSQSFENEPSIGLILHTMRLQYKELQCVQECTSSHQVFRHIRTKYNIKDETLYCKMTSLLQVKSYIGGTYIQVVL